MLGARGHEHRRHRPADIAAIDGFGLLGGEIGFLTSTLIVIDITLAGLFWAWGVDEGVLARLIRKTLYISFFAFIIGNFNRLAESSSSPSAASA